MLQIKRIPNDSRIIIKHTSIPSGFLLDIKLAAALYKHGKIFFIFIIVQDSVIAKKQSKSSQNIWILWDVCYKLIFSYQKVKKHAN